MDCGPEIRTDRLILRRWRDEDREPFTLMNSDPQVVAFFPNALSRDESDAMASRIAEHFERHGFGYWALEVVGGESFIGMAGLAIAEFEAPFTPAVETGWRLARAQWGNGYATEAAAAALRYGFECLGLHEIVSFTVPDNVQSRRVMERLGMTHNATDDFDNPRLPVGHPLRRNVLYRGKRPA